MISRGPNGKRNNAHWLCLCDCGTETTVASGALRLGTTKSCGCYDREIAAQRCRERATHNGHSKPEYSIWIDMRRRCSDPSRDNYKNYGAKGVRVCERWQNSFADFFADMGSRPSKLHTIDRTDSTGNYEPGNCSWADRFAQANNRAVTQFVVYRGETLAFADALRRAGSVVEKSTARLRLKRGWTVEAALETRTS